MNTEITAEKVREVLRPYALQYLAQLCQEYEAECDTVYVNTFSPHLCTNPQEEIERLKPHQDYHMGVIEKVIKDIRSVDKRETSHKEQNDENGEKDK